MMKTFDQWDIDDLEQAFSLERVSDLPTLETWLSADFPMNDVERTIIAALQENLAAEIDLWNEDELKFKFIAPFVNLVRYDTPYFHTFTQRTLSATVGDVQMSGRVDFMVATGKSKPVRPFFFLHEYKKTFAPNNNPLAQLLAEMITAQELNTIPHPLYGSYIVGRSWFFVVLEGRKYAVSEAFLATSDDIIKVISILKAAKADFMRFSEKTHTFQ
ncbi:MAG: hypothetical protein ACOVSW_23180 [Candidatus Kapaibacteriota bacterium]